MTKHFPDDWPDCCPPNDAQERKECVYAAARENPFADEDFSSAYDRDVYLSHDECKRRGISVMLEASDVRSLLERFPKMYKHVASAQLDESHGMLKETPTQCHGSHCALWTYVGIDLKKVFCIHND